jgi:diguanylate cyclase (GGDEF)-like protein/PAS domain S-box-containing protein
MAESSPVDMNPSMEHSAVRGRLGGLVEQVTASVTEISAATNVFEALPASLARLSAVLRFDRVVVVETAPDDAAPGSQRLLFQWTADDCTAPPLRALTVPVVVEGRPWGQVGFDDCRSEHGWPADEVKSLGMLAQVIGAAITRERFRRQARQRERLLQAVTLCAAQIGTAQELREALDRSLAVLGQAVDVDRMLVMEVLGESPDVTRRSLLRNFWHRADTPLPVAQIARTTTLAPDKDVAAWMEPLRRGQVVDGQLASAAPGVRELFQRLQARSVLLVPIMVAGSYWGHIGLDVCRHERCWSSAETDVLKILADIIGVAIMRERHLAELARADTIIQKSPTVLYRLRAADSLPMIYVSKNIERIGHSQQELLASPLLYRSLIHPEDRDHVTAAMDRLLHDTAAAGSFEFRMLTADGSARWFENCYTPVRNEAQRLIEIEGILIDISERKAAEASIAKLARTDVLTGLANRMTFSDHLHQAFAAAQRGARAFAVLYLDLDRFKEVNDTLGHHAGDRLLQEVSRRLRDGTREIDLVARLGGDEFAIVQTGVDDSAAAGTLAEKLIEIVSAPYVLDGNDLRIGVSIGISLYDGDAGSPDALLMQADQALYRAKHAGRGRYRFHSDEIDHEVRAHMTLAEDLRSALARHELEMRYQPQVQLASGKIVGMEALLRWNHPTRGLLLPEDFLPIAEKYGLMQQLGRWAMDTACRQMSLWRSAGMQVPVVAINVALAQIKMGREFVRDVLDSIARWGLKPADVELDVTELVLARSTLSQNNVLDQLRRIGVGIAIDNFGSQYSSLDYLRTYGVSRLKIARGMIAAADAEPGGVAMVRAILSLAGELGIDVVAEGVETDTQRKLLVQASLHAQGQGFFYSRAVPADETMPMLRAGVVLPDAAAHSQAAPADASADAPAAGLDDGKRVASS